MRIDFNKRLEGHNYLEGYISPQEPRYSEILKGRIILFNYNLEGIEEDCLSIIKKNISDEKDRIILKVVRHNEAEIYKPVQGSLNIFSFITYGDPLFRKFDFLTLNILNSNNQISKIKEGLFRENPVVDIGGKIVYSSLVEENNQYVRKILNSLESLGYSFRITPSEDKEILRQLAKTKKYKPLRRFSDREIERMGQEQEEERIRVEKEHKEQEEKYATGDDPFSF